MTIPTLARNCLYFYQLKTVFVDYTMIFVVYGKLFTIMDAKQKLVILLRKFTKSQ